MFPEKNAEVRDAIPIDLFAKERRAIYLMNTEAGKEMTRCEEGEYTLRDGTYFKSMRTPCVYLLTVAIQIIGSYYCFILEVYVYFKLKSVLVVKDMM